MSAHGKVEVRWEQPDDAQAETAVRATEDGYGCRPLPPPRHLHWATGHGQHGSGGILLAEIDGQVVGRAHLEAVHPPFGEIQNMQVMPAFRGRGAGGAILDACFLHLRRHGFMSVFLQTHQDYTAAQRLYARRGFLVAAKGRMLRLVRFLQFPLLDAFLYERPLATYRGPMNPQGRTWPLVWEDWASGDRLCLELTGGSSDKDSDDYGPGLAGVQMRLARQDFTVHLDGPTRALPCEPFRLTLAARNQAADSLKLSARLLLPAGCQPPAKEANRGFQASLAPGEERQFCFEIRTTEEMDLEALRHASFTSLPLTVEVFASGSSCWLTHGLMVEPRQVDK